MNFFRCFSAKGLILTSNVEVAKSNSGHVHPLYIHNSNSFFFLVITKTHFFMNILSFLLLEIFSPDIE